MKKKNSPIKNFKPDILPSWPQKMKLSKTQKEMAKTKTKTKLKKMTNQIDSTKPKNQRVFEQFSIENCQFWQLGISKFSYFRWIRAD